MISPMSHSHDKYLRQLEDCASKGEAREYLWPSTPRSGDLQHKIRSRVGVSDLEVGDPRSRPAMIAEDRGRGQTLSGRTETQGTDTSVKPFPERIRRWER